MSHRIGRDLPPLFVQELENRSCPAFVSLGFGGTVLAFTAASGEDNDVTVTKTGDFPNIGYTIKDANHAIWANAPPFAIQPDGTVVLAAPNGNNVQKVLINLLNADDVAQVIGDIPCHMLGGDGKDKLLGSSLSDTLEGGAGEDYLDGQGGGDLLYGNSDNDLIFGGEGNDTMYGGLGDDEFWGEGGDDRMVGEDGVDELNGGLGADTFVVTPVIDDPVDFDAMEGDVIIHV